MQNFYAMYMVSLVFALILSTPLLYMVNSATEHTVNTVLNEATKSAANKGQFTDEIIENEIYKRLEERNIPRDKVEFTGTRSLTSRGEYIEATIKIPRTPIILFSIFGENPEDITKSTRMMSEYIHN
ncbi:hypothetical protein ACWE42_11460 [Sutcliffiella cohnii]